MASATALLWVKASVRFPLHKQTCDASAQASRMCDTWRIILGETAAEK